MAERSDVVPLVSIITLNYNQADATVDFLRSVQQLTYPRYEVIVLDNGSTRNIFGPEHAAQFPTVTLITNSVNEGFAGGNNTAIDHAQGDYFLLLNNDTEVPPDLIERLLEPFRDDPKVGVACPKIRYASQRDIIQYAGYRPLNRLTGQTTTYGGYQTDRGQFDQARLTNFAHGAAMMVSRAATERAGLMNRDFFLYYEELEWSHRIRRAGYRIYYQPLAVVYHHASLSVGVSSPMQVFYLTRNRIWFMRSCVNRTRFGIFLLYFSMLALPKNLLQYVLKGQWAQARAFWRGVIASAKKPSGRPVAGV